MTVREWFRVMRGEEVRRLVDPAGEDPAAWTVFDTRTLVDRVTARHYLKFEPWEFRAVWPEQRIGGSPVPQVVFARAEGR